MKTIQALINMMHINAYCTKVGGNYCVQLRGGPHRPIAWGPTIADCKYSLWLYWATH